MLKKGALTAISVVRNLLNSSRSTKQTFSHVVFPHALVHRYFQKRVPKEAWLWLHAGFSSSSFFRVLSWDAEILVSSPILCLFLLFGFIPEEWGLLSIEPKRKQEPIVQRLESHLGGSGGPLTVMLL